MSGALLTLTDQVLAMRKELVQLRQRLNATVMTGTVKAVQGATVTVDLGEDEDGQPMETPQLRMAAPTGHGGAGVSTYTKLGLGEAVAIISPNGELGTESVVIPWADTGARPAPGAAETDGLVHIIGNARLDLRNGFARLGVGSASVELTGAKLTVALGDTRIELTSGLVKITADRVENNGRNIGHDHVNTGVVPGGGLSGPPT